jgi:hypothetical protein
MKKILIALTYAGVVYTAAFASYFGGNTHSCPFELCPYKGYISFEGVINTGESTIDVEQDGSDTWAIDKLHFQYPAASYDSLETMLFNQ